MPQDLDAFLVALGDDGELGVAFDAVRRIDQLPVHLAGKGRAREARADRLRNLGHSDRAGKALHGAIGKTDVRHQLRALNGAPRPFQREQLSRRFASGLTIGRRDWNRTNDLIHVKDAL